MVTRVGAWAVRREAWGRTVSTGLAEAGLRAEVVRVLVKQPDGAYTPIHSSHSLLN